MSDAVSRAEKLAAERHEGQARKGTDRVPYVTHCREAAELVAAHGGGEQAVIAGWLHDVVEKTPTTLEEIGRLFGPKVAGIVAELTDDPALDEEAARAEQIRDAPKLSREAALVKAADQTSNMRSVASAPSRWPREERMAYVAKARAVVAGLQAPASLKAVFEEAAQAAERAG